MYMQSKISLISRHLIYVDQTSLFLSILNKVISDVNLTFCMTSDFGYILSLLFRQIGRRSKDFFFSDTELSQNRRNDKVSKI